MQRVEGYKIIKHKQVWFVLNENDDARKAIIDCLYRAETFLECKNWIQQKKVWFRKPLKNKNEKKIEKLQEIGKRIGFYK